MSGANFSLERVENDNTRVNEYEELLLKRDQLFRESGSYMTAYTQEFGDMITANFELKVECIKKKKTISYCRRRMNRGLAIDTTRMQAEIDKEMTLYYAQLKEMADDNERAKKAGTISEYRLNRAKKIYRRLTKILHPDINKKTAEDENLRELWEKVAEAYQRSDADALDDLEVLVRRAMDTMGDESFELNLDDIEERIERVENQINEILTTEPYIYGELLNDEEKKQAHKEQLQAEHGDFEQYLESLSKTFDDMLREGGVTLVWQMN
jgi:iron-sulfur cluster repair protein YtfE (RIC family)